MRAGHIYIDLKNEPLTSTPVKIPGVYEHIEGNYGKVPVLYNMVIGDKEVDMVNVLFDVSGTSFVASFYFGATLKTITVTEDDMVSIA